MDLLEFVKWKERRLLAAPGWKVDSYYTGGAGKSLLLYLPSDQGPDIGYFVYVKSMLVTAGIYEDARPTPQQPSIGNAKFHQVWTYTVLGTTQQAQMEVFLKLPKMQGLLKEFSRQGTLVG